MTQDMNKVVGANIKTLRIRHQMRQADLAQELEIYQSQVHRMENGQGIDANLLLQIARIFNVDLEDLYHKPETLDITITVTPDDVTYFQQCANQPKIYPKRIRDVLGAIVIEAGETIDTPE